MLLRYHKNVFSRLVPVKLKFINKLYFLYIVQKCRLSCGHAGRFVDIREIGTYALGVAGAGGGVDGGVLEFRLSVMAGAAAKKGDHNRKQCGECYLEAESVRRYMMGSLPLP